MKAHVQNDPPPHQLCDDSFSHDGPRAIRNATDRLSIHDTDLAHSTYHRCMPCQLSMNWHDDLRMALRSSRHTGEPGDMARELGVKLVAVTPMTDRSCSMLQELIGFVRVGAFNIPCQLNSAHSLPRRSLQHSFGCGSCINRPWKNNIETLLLC